MSDEIHESAALGYERRSDTYAKARPSYHPTVLDRLVAALPAGPIVDLGAGTGISTAALLARGCDVTAVEPVEAMRVTLAEQVPGSRVVEGTAEQIPLADSSVAAVVVAQAFHWFDHAPALEEISRVLSNDGMLVTLWNVRDETVPWMAAYTQLQVPVEGDTPRYRDMDWRRSLEDDRRFELALEVATPNPQPSSPELDVGRFLSTSFVARLDDDHQQRLADQVRLIVAPLGDSFEFPYRCEAQLWQL